jgi:hypothetical protein
MNYQKFDSDKAFIVMQRSGTGVMEDPYTDVGVVFETNDKDEAKAKSKELFHANNSPEAIKSTWCNNTYWVIANINTEVGKNLLDAFHRESDRIVQQAKDSGNYHEYGSEGYKIGVVGPKDNFMSRDMDNKKGFDYSNAGIMFPIGYDKELGGIQRRCTKPQPQSTPKVAKE